MIGHASYRLQLPAGRVDNLGIAITHLVTADLELIQWINADPQSPMIYLLRQSSG